MNFGEQFELNRGYMMQLEGFGRICFKTPKWSGYEIIYWKEIQT